MNVRLAGILIASAMASIAALHAQTAGDGVIRSETRLVLVDAVPVDKNNNFPRDLTQKDFRIWEDGKEQKITSFSLESAGVSPERSNKHYIALFFDTYSSTQLRERQQASLFADGFASPDRYMSVVDSFGAGLRVVQNFTNDPAQVKKGLSDLTVGSRAAAPAAGGGGGGRGGRGGDQAANGGQFIDSRNLLNALKSTANSLAAIRGRKALVLFSLGFNMNSEMNNDVKAAIDACNKANVAVYSVLLGATFGGGAGGGAVVSAENSSAPAGGRGGGRGGGGGGEDSSANPDPEMNAMRSIAEGTGGFTLLTTNDLTNVLGKIAREQDAYYLLGYTPAVESAEGTCHSLKVKTDRGGLTVRARESYCTSKSAGLLSQPLADKNLEARAASKDPGTIPSKMQLPWFYSGPNTAQVDIALDMVPSQMKLQKQKGKLHGEIEIAGMLYKPDDSLAGRFSDTVTLDFDTQQQADAFLHAPYHYVNQFQIPPGQYNFRLAFSPGDQAIGKVDMPLDVDPWDGKVLTMSGLALSRDAHPYAGLAAGAEDAILEGPHPLVSNGTEIVPTGTYQFSAGERCLVYFEVYQPTAPLPGIEVRVRVLDRATGEPKSDSGPIPTTSFMRPGNPVMSIGLQTRTTDLPAGKYKMEVTVTRENEKNPVVRTADFDVI